MEKPERLVCFAHGKEGTPWGSKIARLAEVARGRGWAVDSPDFRAIPDPDQRVRRLLELHPSARGPLVLVGSSMGAYQSVVASRTLQPAGLFLMAPAVYLWDYAEQDPTPNARWVTVVHGWSDTVVPPANAVRFARQHGATLHMVQADHPLQSALPVIARLFDWFLEDVEAGVKAADR
ncbi:MAG: alpha/beta hydrolase [Magnetococcales bacterium]|nr:alpha/beta hydrolase [Magnetococcales bacterium]